MGDQCRYTEPPPDSRHDHRWRQSVNPLSTELPVQILAIAAFSRKWGIMSPPQKKNAEWILSLVFRRRTNRIIMKERWSISRVFCVVSCCMLSLLHVSVPCCSSCDACVVYVNKSGIRGLLSLSLLLTLEYSCTYNLKKRALDTLKFCVV